MKLVSFLTHTAAVSGATFLLGLAFDAHALALFSTTAAASILLIASHDYAPRLAGEKISSPSAVVSRRRHSLRLAV